MAGLTLFCIDITQEERFLVSRPNVSGEVPLFSITHPMTLYVVLARQCSVKKGVCV